MTKNQEVKVIEIKKSIFADNNADADNLRKELKDKGVFLLNLMIHKAYLYHTCGVPAGNSK